MTPIAAILLGWALSACATPPSKAAPRESALREELLHLKDADQAARQAVIAGNFKDEKANERMSVVDRANTARLRQILDTVGWPGKSLVGEDGAQAAWLLAQHADLDVEFQERCLRLMEPMTRDGEASKADYAYLVDRVLVKHGRPQRYGTQMISTGEVYDPGPLEDPERLDERRASMGLPPWADYVKRMREESARK